MAAVNISPTFAVATTMNISFFAGKTYTYPQGTIALTSTAKGARISVAGTDLGVDVPPYDLKALADLLSALKASTGGLGNWKVTYSAPNFTLYYKNASTGLAATRHALGALQRALWSYLG